MDELQKELDEAIAKLEELKNGDMAKFASGNKTAATRVRKSLMEVRDLLQKMRKDVMNVRNEM